MISRASHAYPAEGRGSDRSPRDVSRAPAQASRDAAPGREREQSSPFGFDCPVHTFRPNGETVNLANVVHLDIDFAEMAATLAKIARFDGRTKDPNGYSVAQHSVFVADALAAETGDALLAGCGLLHDGHEYLIGDITRPVAAIIGNRLAAFFENRGCSGEVANFARGAVKCVIGDLKAEIDNAVYTAAGVDYPRLYPTYRRLVEQMDDRMLRAEGLALFGKKAAPHLPAARLPAPKLPRAIVAWPGTKAEFAFLDRLEKYLGITVRPA